MTPQEKAKDLFDNYYYCLLQSNIEKRNYWSKQCALIAVDEIIEALPCREEYGGEWKLIDNTEFWQEVKQELEKL